GSSRPDGFVPRKRILETYTQQRVQRVQGGDDSASPIVRHLDRLLDAFPVKNLGNQQATVRCAQKPHESWPAFLTQQVRLANEHIGVDNNNDHGLSGLRWF